MNKKHMNEKPRHLREGMRDRDRDGDEKSCNMASMKETVMPRQQFSGVE